MADANGAYTRGYISTMSKRQKQEFRDRFYEKSIIKASGHTLAHLVALFAAIALIYFGFTKAAGLGASLICVVVGVVLAIRQMRALENIVHFGSHLNFSRDRRLNDGLTNLLAAWPLLQDVAPYRIFHTAHHGSYGDDIDPCRARLEQIGVPVSSIDNRRALFTAIIRWLPLYVREYYREVSSGRKQIIRFVLWHSILWIITAISISANYATFQSIVFVVLMGVLLPLLRSVAELSEHDYERGDSVKETTFNNLGWLDHLFIHPAGDAWHALHHLYPSVSWWKQRAAHRFLIENDRAYQSALHRTALYENTS